MVKVSAYGYNSEGSIPFGEFNYFRNYLGFCSKYFSPRQKFQVPVPDWNLVHVPCTSNQSNYHLSPINQTLVLVPCTSTRYKYLVLVPVNQISYSRNLKVPRILLVSFVCRLPTQMLHVVQHLGGSQMLHNVQHLGGILYPSIKPLYLSIKTCHLSCTSPN